MNGTSESTGNILISALMGLLGGLITTPINAIFSWTLKRDEQNHQYKLDLALLKYKLLMEHKLELARKGIVPPDETVRKLNIPPSKPTPPRNYPLAS